LPLILGSDLSGIVEDVGAGVDEVFGVANFRFTDAYAAYVVAEAAMIARLGWRKQSGEFPE
jgi:NADPH:quinone reductase-like Zn-dependent oxidoreductase